MNIAILGAGVGGVTTAIALVQRGYDVSIFERTPEPAHIGAGLVVWPNASFVLSELGLLSQVATLSGRPGKMRRVSAHGEDLGYLDIMALDAHMGFHSYSILRRDLQSVLLGELCRLGIEVHYNHSVSSLAAADDGKTHVLFRNGLQLTPDVVIGADGRMRSVARRRCGCRGRGWCSRMARRWNGRTACCPSTRDGGRQWMRSWRSCT